MSKKIAFLLVSVLVVRFAKAQSPAPTNVFEVLMYSATYNPAGGPAGAVPSVFTETKVPTVLGGTGFVSTATNASNYSASRNIVQLNNALNAGIATALSIIPLSSPASGVIFRADPATGAELPESSTLGPILSERAETIGKHKIYLGFSHQDFHFTKYNGTSLNSLSVLYPGGDSSQILLSQGATTGIATKPATFDIGMDVRLSQDIAFLTYGVTGRFDVTLGLPVIHSGVEARTYNGMIYAGTGFGITNGSNCWCVDTFTPGAATLEIPQIGNSSLSKTGFGDLLLRLKGSVVRRRSVVVAAGADLRFATGDAENYTGTGATSVKPFAAVSLYSKPVRKSIVFAPHFDLGWQLSGKSMLGGDLLPTALAQNYLGAPFTTSKDYLPDVFSWTAGTEVALGHRTTLIADILGNQIGWIHGIPNTMVQSISGVSLPEGVTGNSAPDAPTPTMGTATGLVSAGRVSFGQYSGSFGYKARIFGNLIANFNLLVRFDNNGLTARVVPLYGLGYSF